MVVWLLKKLGFTVSYVCEWGEYQHRYGYLDRVQTRPIHKDMSVAPPWAKMKVSRSTTHHHANHRGGENG